MIRILIVLILMIGFTNPFSYGNRFLTVMLIPLCFLNIKKLLKYLDFNFFLILIFSISYFLFSLSHYYIDETLMGAIMDIILFPLMYLTGKYLFDNKDENIKSNLFLKISISYGIVVLYSVLEQIILYGFSEGIRSMYIIWNRNELFSATNLAGYLVLYTTYLSSYFNVDFSNKTEKKSIIIMSILFVLNVICMLRLGSRTLIVTTILSLLFSLLFFNKRKPIFIGLFFVILFLLISYFMLNNELDVFSFFRDRMESEDAGVGSAGGRTQRWDRALELMSEYPWGWEYELTGHMHNLWLDVYRRAGIVSFSLLLILTILTFSKFLKFFRKNIRNTTFFKSNICNIYMVIFLILSVEPVLEGYKLVFALYCFLNGIIVIELNKNKNENIISQRNLS